MSSEKSSVHIQVILEPDKEECNGLENVGVEAAVAGSLYVEECAESHVVGAEPELLRFACLADEHKEQWKENNEWYEVYPGYCCQYFLHGWILYENKEWSA